MARIEFDLTGTLEALASMMEGMENDLSVQCIMVLTCDENQFITHHFNAHITAVKKPIFGGIFPQIIYENHAYARGSIVVGFPFECTLDVLESLQAETELTYNFVPQTASLTRVVFVDGLTSGIGMFMESLFIHLGVERPYIGGGAGSLSLKPSACIITPKGLLQDSAIVATLNTSAGIGVAHGWKIISPSFKVSSSSKNTLHTLDWEEAFTVYKNVVEGHSGQKFNDTNFFDIAKAYPFGIGKYDSEVIVRDPLFLGEKGSMICVGEVPEGSFVHILHGHNESLLKAASLARTRAQEACQCTKATYSMTLFIDCISRVLFLEDAFNDEIAAVKENDVVLVGALTLGEIANNGKDSLEFYNKTSVVGLFQ
jgi:hypothetical protein